MAGNMRVGSRGRFRLVDLVETILVRDKETRGSVLVSIAGGGLRAIFSTDLPVTLSGSQRSVRSKIYNVPPMDSHTVTVFPSERIVVTAPRGAYFEVEEEPTKRPRTLHLRLT